MTLIRALWWVLGGCALSTAQAQELTRYQYDRAGNIVGIVVGPEAESAETVEVDPVAAKVGERVRIHTEVGALIDSVRFGEATATPVLNDHHGLEVIVPTGATSGPVDLYQGGAKRRTSGAFAVVPAEIPSATVAGIRPADLANEMDLGLIGGRWTLLSFDSQSAGARTLQLTALEQPAAAPVDVRVLGPLGTVLHSGTTTLTTQTTHIPMPQAAGTHILALRTPRWARVRAQLQSDALLVPDGTPTTVNAAQAVPTARLQFTASAGEDFGLGFDAMTTNNTSKMLIFDVRQPNGSVWKTTKCGSSSVQNQCDLALRNVPATGLYTVLARAESTSVTQFSARIWLSREIQQPISIATPTAIVIPRPGQIASYTFVGEAGKYMHLSQKAFSAVANSGFEYVVRRPDGQCLVPTTCAPFYAARGNDWLDLGQLPQSGEYVIQLGLYNGGLYSGTGSATLTLTADAESLLEADAAAVVIAAPLTGQRHRLTFMAQAGDDLSLGISHLAVSPSGDGITTQLYRPDGTLWRSSACGVYGSMDDCGEVLRDLPESGTYTYVVRPERAATMSYSARVWLSRELLVPLTINTPSALVMPRPGQIATLSFAGTAGQYLSLSAKDVVVPNDTAMELLPKSPAGACLVTADCKAWRPGTKNFVALPRLTASGAYTVPVRFWTDGGHSGNGNATITLSEAIAAAGTVDSGYTQVASQLYGQQHRITFEGTAGESLGLGVNGYSTTPAEGDVDIDVFRPSGALYKTANCSGSTQNKCDAVMRGLPESGTYTAVVRPANSGTLGYSARIYMSREVGLTLTLGTPAVLSMTRPGQIATVTFEGTAGQRLRLNASNFASTPSGRNYEFLPLRPTGACLLSTDCAPWRVSNTAFKDFPALLESGQHKIRVEFYNDGKTTPYGNVTLNLAPTP